MALVIGADDRAILDEKERPIVRYRMFVDLPAPLAGRTGWPWTEETPPLPPTMPDGRPWPRISIVTPSFNQGQFIEETIRSVLLQGYPNLEYIIIDGGSTDGTVEIIKKYEGHIDYWVSEKDRGQSHAINKGLARCTGEIFNWINSDDVLAPQALNVVARAWGQKSNAIICGALEWVRDGRRERVERQQAVSFATMASEKEKARQGRRWNQPGTFLPLAAVKAVGGVQENLHFSMDRMLMLSILRRTDVVYVDDVLARFRLHSESKSCTRPWMFGVEEWKAMLSVQWPEMTEFRDEMRECHVKALWDAFEMEYWHGRRSRMIGFATDAFRVYPLRSLREVFRRKLISRAIGNLLRRKVSKGGENQ